MIDILMMATAMLIAQVTPRTPHPEPPTTTIGAANSTNAEDESLAKMLEETRIVRLTGSGVAARRPETLYRNGEWVGTSGIIKARWYVSSKRLCVETSSIWCREIVEINKNYLYLLEPKNKVAGKYRIINIPKGS